MPLYLIAAAAAAAVVASSRPPPPPPPPGPAFEYGGLRLELALGPLTASILNVTTGPSPRTNRPAPIDGDHGPLTQLPASALEAPALLPPPPAPPPNHDYNFVGPRTGTVPKGGCHMLGELDRCGAGIPLTPRYRRTLAMLPSPVPPVFTKVENAGRVRSSGCCWVCALYPLRPVPLVGSTQLDPPPPQPLAAAAASSSVGRHLQGTWWSGSGQSPRARMMRTLPRLGRKRRHRRRQRARCWTKGSTTTAPTDRSK